MAAADFHLPDLAPPGNLFPSRTGTPVQPMKMTVSEIPSLKIDTRQVVIAVTEAPQLLPPPPARIAHPRVPTPDRSNRAAVSSEQRSVSRESPEAPSHGSSTTLNDDGVGHNEQSPVMRSMFPQLNSSMPLSQQQYFPTLERPPPQIVALGESSQYSPSLYSQPRSPPTALLAADPWAASRIPSTLIHASPLRITEDALPELSKPEQLLDFWTIANGQESSKALDSYVLGLKCESLASDSETICLTSSSAPLYTLHSSGATVVITRTHPLNPSTEIKIFTPTLSTPSVITPLLATLFPSLAELLAIDTASDIASSHHLPRQEGIRLQTDALDRARRTEATSLLWDSDSSAYYLSLPSLQHKITSSPSDSSNTNDATETLCNLPIDIQPEAHIRLLNSSQQPLLTLNLQTHVLTLQTRNIASLTASLYTLDILIGSLLTLLLHLHRDTSLLAPQAAPLPQMHFDPPPTSARNSPRIGSKHTQKTTRLRLTPTPQQPGPSRWLSLRRAFTPTPSAPASRAPSAMGTPHPLQTTTTIFPHSPNPSTLAFDKDLESAFPLPPGTTTTLTTPNPILGLAPTISTPIPPAGIAPELRASTTGVDLSRFQAFDLEDPELSRGTKIVLRLIYWAFGVLVWVLGVGVGCLAAAVVAVGGCFGGRVGGREG